MGNDMSIEQGGDDRLGINPTENTSLNITSRLPQPETTEFSQDSPTKTEDERSLAFDRRSNFVLTPSTASGPQIHEDPKSEHILNAQIPGKSMGERGAGGIGGSTRRKNPFRGVKTKVLAAVAATGIALGGGAAYLVNQSEESTGESPDSRPTQLLTPDPTSNTAEATQQPQTPEATPTPKIEKYPLEFAKVLSVGNVDVALTKDIVEKGISLDANTGQNRPEGIKVNDVILESDLPDAEERLQTGVMYGLFLAWQSEDSSRSTISFEQFQTKLQNNEDLSFSVYGYNGDSFIPEIEEIKIDPRKKISIVILGSPSTLMKPFAGNNYGYRTLNSELYIELFDYKGFGVGNPINADSDLDVGLSWALALMSEREYQKEGDALLGEDFQRVLNRKRSLDSYFIPLKEQDYWQGVLQVR